MGQKFHYIGGSTAIDYQSIALLVLYLCHTHLDSTRPRFCHNLGIDSVREPRSTFPGTRTKDNDSYLRTLRSLRRVPRLTEKFYAPHRTVVVCFKYIFDKIHFIFKQKFLTSWDRIKGSVRIFGMRNNVCRSKPKHCRNDKVHLTPIKLIESSQEIMFSLSKLLSFYHKLLIIAILTTHHNDTLFNSRAINSVMSHAISTHL